MSAFDVGLVSLTLKRRAIPWLLHYEPACESTQDLARRALQEGSGAGWLVITDHQRAGRGRQGRAWTAPPERSLLFSCILAPDPQSAEILPIAAGVAVADGIRECAGLGPDLKWPNDVMVGDRKLAGILTERPPGSAVILGVGVNVSQTVDELPPGATSLAIATGGAVRREALLASILNALDDTLGRLLTDGPAWLIDAWRHRTSMLGRRVSLKVKGVVRDGVAEDVEANGGLVIRFQDGSRKAVVAGEVEMIRRANGQS